MKSLAEVLRDNRAAVLASWRANLTASVDGLVGSEETIASLYERLLDGFSRSAANSLNDPSFGPISAHMTVLSVERARDGFSPSATSRLLAAFKAAVEPVLRAEYASDLDRWQQELRKVGDIVDQLSVLTFEAYMKAREEVIARQSHAMLEISTPALRIWEDIILMPLIGVIDTSRAQHVMEQLLLAISANEARVAILDVTGVPIIDTRVALHLTKVVQAARMLGAEIVVTGISPEAAQTLVRLDVDLSSIRTRGSLRAGFSEALRVLKRRVGTID